VLDGDGQSGYVGVVEPVECELREQLGHGRRRCEASGRGEDARHIVQAAVSIGCGLSDSLGYGSSEDKGAIGAGVVLSASPYCDEVGCLVGGEREAYGEWDVDATGGACAENGLGEGDSVFERSGTSGRCGKG